MKGFKGCREIFIRSTALRVEATVLPRSPVILCFDLLDATEII